jgi:hypothetical protein
MCIQPPYPVAEADEESFDMRCTAQGRATGCPGAAGGGTCLYRKISVSEGTKRCGKRNAPTPAPAPAPLISPPHTACVAPHAPVENNNRAA